MIHNKKRIDGLDLMKAIGILMVVSLHVPLWQLDFISSPDWQHKIQYALRLIAEGVPIFLMVNGFLLLRKTEFDFEKHIRKMGKIFCILLIWSVILTLIGSWMAGEILTFRSFLLYILNTCMGSTYTGVLWFLQSLLAVYLVFPLIWHIYKEHQRVFEYFFVILFLFGEVFNGIGLLRDYLGTCTNIVVIDSLLVGITRFNAIDNLWYVFYFCLGGMIWNHIMWIQQHRKSLIFAGGMAWAMAYLYGYMMSMRIGEIYNPAYNYNSPFMLVMLIGLFALVLPYENKGKFVQKLLSSIGANTFGIYSSHFIFIFIIQKYYFYQNFGQGLLVYLIVFLCSYLFSILIKRIPILHWIVEI